MAQGKKKYNIYVYERMKEPTSGHTTSTNRMDTEGKKIEDREDL